MLELTIGGTEYFDEVDMIFRSDPPTILKLEHSLYSISKWESKWKKVFLDDKVQRTLEESIDYIKCMTINKNIDPSVYSRIRHIDLAKVDEYINDPMTATWFSKENRGAPSRKKVTSEVIYHWMIMNGIPFECDKWHLNRLLTLIRVCEAEQGKQKKMSKKDIMAQNRAINASRKAKHHSKG